MEEILIGLERSGAGTWVRESLQGFPLMLVLHAWGMSLLAGVNLALGLRLLGLAPGLPLAALRQLYPLVWGGFALSLFSGLALLLAYPAKSLTNPLFFFKLACIAGALWLAVWLKRRVFHPAAAEGSTGAGAPARAAPAIPAARAKLAALALLALWFTVITSGRFLAYTYSVLLLSD